MWRFRRQRLIKITSHFRLTLTTLRLIKLVYRHVERLVICHRSKDEPIPCSGSVDIASAVPSSSLLLPPITGFDPLTFWAAVRLPTVTPRRHMDSESPILYMTLIPLSLSLPLAGYPLLSPQTAETALQRTSRSRAVRLSCL